MLMYPLVPGTDYPKYFNPYIVNIISEIADGTSVFLLLGWVPLGSPIPILIPKKSIVDGRWWPYRTASRPHPQVPAWFRGSKWSQWALQFRNQHHLNVKWLWHVYEMIIYIYTWKTTIDGVDEFSHHGSFGAGGCVWSKGNTSSIYATSNLEDTAGMLGKKWDKPSQTIGFVGFRLLQTSRQWMDGNICRKRCF